MKKHNRAMIGLMSASLIAICSGTAQAQTAPATEQESEDNGEIVVTAQKRTELAGRIGISLAVVSPDSLTTRNITVAEDLSKVVPGLEISSANGPGTQPSIYLRGVELNDFNFNNSGPIAVYADETYKSSFVGQSVFMYDIQRVEVLKGPQGTLFGRNATGGALRIISNKPTSVLSAAGSAQYSSFGTTQFEAMGNVPLGDKVQLRVSGIKADSDGFITNNFDGSHVRGYDFSSGRILLNADLASNLNVLLSAQFDKYKGKGSGFSFQGTTDPNTSANCTNAAILAGACTNYFGYGGEDGFYENSTDLQQYLNRNVETYSAVIGWNFGAFDITSVTSYEEAALAMREDTDSSPLRLLEVDQSVESQTFEQELRLSYDGDGLKGTLGAFYLDESLDQDQTANLFPMLRPDVEAIDPVAYPGGFDPVGSAIGFPVFFARVSNQQTTEAWAIFGQGQYSLSSTFRLIGGLRYNSEQRDFRTKTAFVEPTFEVPIFDIPLAVKNDNISFKIGAEWDAGKDVLTYATISTGQKSGGFNGGFLFDAAQVVPYGPEKITAFEAGLKANLRSANIHFNAAAFYYDYKDIQVFTFVNSGQVPISLLTNAADARIWGLEADLVWRPTSRWTVSGAATYLNSKFNRFTTAATSGGDYTGNRLALTPQFTATMRIDYEHPIGNDFVGKAYVAGNYKSKVFFEPSNNELYSQSGYALLDGGLSFGPLDDTWSISVFGTNLLKRKYLTYALDFSSFGFNTRTSGEPRVVGVRVNFKF